MVVDNLPMPVLNSLRILVAAWAQHAFVCVLPYQIVARYAVVFKTTEIRTRIFSTDPNIRVVLDCSGIVLPAVVVLSQSHRQFLDCRSYSGKRSACLLVVVALAATHAMDVSTLDDAHTMKMAEDDVKNGIGDIKSMESLEAEEENEMAAAGKDFEEALATKVTHEPAAEAKALATYNDAKKNVKMAEKREKIQSQEGQHALGELQAAYLALEKPIKAGAPVPEMVKKARKKVESVQATLQQGVKGHKTEALLHKMNAELESFDKEMELTRVPLGETADAASVKTHGGVLDILKKAETIEGQGDVKKAFKATMTKLINQGKKVDVAEHADTEELDSLIAQLD